MSCANTERDYSKRSQITSIDEQRGRIDKQISATAENQQERKQYQYSPSSSSDIEKVGFSFYPHAFTNLKHPFHNHSNSIYTFILTNLCHVFAVGGIKETRIQIIQITKAEI